jgi:hypothetical protein
MQLEPIEVAGFLQSFRSILPESVAGAVAGAEFETFGLSFNHEFPHGTYISAAAQLLRSEAERTFGVFQYNLPLGLAYTNLGGMRDILEYEEKSLSVAVNQLFGQNWAVGATYRLTDADLEQTFPELLENPASNVSRRQNLDATLHEVQLHLSFVSATGMFGRLEALWFDQKNGGYANPTPGDNFWQFNIFAGYRLWRRKAEFQIGLLNIAAQDYRLNPLTLYQELPRDRTLALRLKINF